MTHDQLDQILVTSRPLADYLLMFGLSETDLKGRILDCPGGASGFTAAACALGADATACDPVYSLDPDELETLAAAEIERSHRWYLDRPDLYDWSQTTYPDIDSVISARLQGLGQFAAHRRNEPGRYVSASLPLLPFGDGAFDLAISSHLLFCYADHFDADFHVAAINELLRVAVSQVRLFPIADYNGIVPPWYEEVISRVLADNAERGSAVSYELIEIDFRAISHCTQAIILTKAPLTG